MNLLYYIPPSLRGMVDMIWEQQSATPCHWKILPSGKVELILRIGPDARMQSARKMSLQDSPLNQFCFLSGLHTRPIVMSFDHFHYIGVQMKPVAVKALFKMPLCEIRDYYANGDSIFSTLDEIESNLNEKKSFIERAKWLETHLYSLINETSELHQAIHLYNASSAFVQCNRNDPDKSIETLLGYSRTQTFRIFNEWFGISAHSYQKLIRFVQSVHELHKSPDNLTSIGLASGYFDQSHFVRSFREFADMTPGEYKKHIPMLPGQLAV